MVNIVTLCKEFKKLRELLTDAHLRYEFNRTLGGQGCVHRDLVTPMLNNQTLSSEDRYTL